MTKQVAHDPHNSDLRAQIASQIASASDVSTLIGQDYRANYVDSGLVNLGLDATTLLSGGLLSTDRDVVDTFLGSYDETYTIKSVDLRTRVATVSFKVTNTTDWQSFMHYISKNCHCDNLHGTGATLTETFVWTATISTQDENLGRMSLAN